MFQTTNQYTRTQSYSCIFFHLVLFRRISRIHLTSNTDFSEATCPSNRAPPFTCRTNFGGFCAITCSKDKFCGSINHVHNGFNHLCRKDPLPAWKYGTQHYSTARHLGSCPNDRGSQQAHFQGDQFLVELASHCWTSTNGTFMDTMDGDVWRIVSTPGKEIEQLIYT